MMIMKDEISVKDNEERYRSLV